MTEFERSDPTLPGLEPPRPTSPALEVAARRTLAALQADGHLDERHALTMQLVVDLAVVVDASARSGKASAAAMAAAQLLACQEALMPALEGGEENDPFDELAAELRCAAHLCDHEEHRAAV